MDTVQNGSGGTMWRRVVAELCDMLREERRERSERTYLTYLTYLTYKRGFLRSTVVYLKDLSPYRR